MSNIRGYALRLSGVVSALAMAVVFVLTYTLAQTTVMSATAQDTRTGTLAQQRLTAPGSAACRLRKRCLIRTSASAWREHANVTLRREDFRGATQNSRL